MPNFASKPVCAFGNTDIVKEGYIHMLFMRFNGFMCSMGMGHEIYASSQMDIILFVTNIIMNIDAEIIHL